MRRSAPATENFLKRVFWAEKGASKLFFGADLGRYLRKIRGLRGSDPGLLASCCLNRRRAAAGMLRPRAGASMRGSVAQGMSLGRQ